MKKTLIAAAVAASVAAPAAFADVKVSGMVAPEFSVTDNGTSTDEGRVWTDLVFSGSEDLGNGLTASFKYHMFADTSGDTGIDAVGGSAITTTDVGVSLANATVAADITQPTSTNADTDGGQRLADLTVALSGDFGTVKMGRFEPFAEGVIDAFANIEGINGMDLESTTGFVSSRTNGNIAYISPTVGGVHIGLSTVELGGEFNKANEIFAQYKNGPLMVMANSSKNDSNNVKHSGVAASYKIDALELRAMKTTMKGQTDTTTNGDYTMIGAKYTMGANTIAVGMSDDETSGTNKESTLISLTHALSKNTSAYIGFKNDDPATGADTDTTIIGVTQKF
jgi:predicted porin